MARLDAILAPAVLAPRETAMTAMARLAPGLCPLLSQPCNMFVENRTPSGKT